MVANPLGTLTKALAFLAVSARHHHPKPFRVHSRRPMSGSTAGGSGGGGNGRGVLTETITWEDVQNMIADAKKDQWGRPGPNESLGRSLEETVSVLKADRQA